MEHVDQFWRSYDRVGDLERFSQVYLVLLKLVYLSLHLIRLLEEGANDFVLLALQSIHGLL